LPGDHYSFDFSRKIRYFSELLFVRNSKGRTLQNKMIKKPNQKVNISTMTYMVIGFMLSLMPLMGQTVSITNTSNSGITPDFIVGDAFTITIAGAAANSAVTVVSYQNGVSNTNGVPFNVGTTNGSGGFTLGGTQTSGLAGTWVEYWYVGGTQVGVLNFDIIDYPTNLALVSATAVAPAGPIAGCTSPYYGLFIDIKYQIRGANGNIPILTVIAAAYETGTFPDLSSFSNYIGPVTGYSQSSRNAASDGTFHDVPVGGCQLSSPLATATLTQTINLIIGTASIQVRQNTFSISGLTLNHGSVSNGSDISVSR
jgi:hypothetical protein